MAKQIHTGKTIGATLASSVLATALALPASAQTSAKERCGDIVKAGKNACAVSALGLSCQGTASKDNLKGVWIKVPAGTCHNIVSICNGDAKAPEGVSDKKMAKVCKKVAVQTDSSVVGGRLVDKFGNAI